LQAELIDVLLYSSEVQPLCTGKHGKRSHAHSRATAFCKKCGVAHANIWWQQLWVEHAATCDSWINWDSASITSCCSITSFSSNCCTYQRERITCVRLLRDAVPVLSLSSVMLWGEKHRNVGTYFNVFLVAIMCQPRLRGLRVVPQHQVVLVACECHISF
jgi:hypothetical protein